MSSVLNSTLCMPSAGDNFKYTEVMGMPNMFAAAVATFLSAVGFVLVAAWPLTPLWRRVLPKAGEGENPIVWHMSETALALHQDASVAMSQAASS